MMNTEKEAVTDSGKAPSVAELENVVSAANTLIDFVIERNIQHTDILDGLNTIRSTAQNDLDDLNGATY